MPRRRHPAHRFRRAGRVAAHRRRAPRSARRRRSRRARLRLVDRRARSRRRRAPRGHGPADEGSGGGSVPRRLAEGRVRDGDALARHQHARALRGGREAVEVHRRAPRAPHAGGVHPARRARRPPRHRRGRVRGRAVGSVRRLRPGRGPRVAAHVRAHVVVPRDLQHGRQPRAAVRARRSAPAARPLVRAVPRRPRRGVAHQAPRTHPGPARPGPRRRPSIPGGDIEEYRVAARRPRRRPPVGARRPGQPARQAPARRRRDGAQAGRARGGA